jgi:two-component system, cell cycle sensor histidine kinase and response regulator CckA
MPPPRVLVVDDEVSNVRLAERLLQSAGYTVSTAGSGAEAWRVIEEHGPFDLYILDIMMPQMRGTELADAIRKKEPRALVLYFTGYSHALFSGARVLKEHEAFIQKPVSKRELLEAVSLLLFNDLQGPREEPPTQGR